MKKPSQLRAIKGLAKASTLSTFRSPIAIFFSFLFPFIFIIAFGLIGQGDPTFEILMRNDSEKTGIIYDVFKDTDVIKLKEDLSDKEIDEQLKKGDAPVAMTIIENESQDPSVPTTYKIVLEKSAADPQNAQTATFIIDSIIESFNEQANGGDQAQTFIEKEEVEVEGRKFKQIDFILPGQLAFALLASAVNGIAYSFITLRKELIIKRIFATPVKKSSILIAEAISRTILALCQAVIIIGVGDLLLGYTLANGLVTFFEMIILTLFGLFTFFAFGLYVSSLGDDEEAIAPAANLIMMPQFILSGAFFPIDVLPSFLQPIAQILPMTFLNDAYRTVAFEGSSIFETLPQIAGLLIWGIIMYLIAIRTFKWE